MEMDGVKTANCSYVCMVLGLWKKKNTDWYRKWKNERILGQRNWDETCEKLGFLDQSTWWVLGEFWSWRVWFYRKKIHWSKIDSCCQTSWSCAVIWIGCERKVVPRFGMSDFFFLESWYPLLSESFGCPFLLTFSLISRYCRFSNWSQITSPYLLLS